MTPGCDIAVTNTVTTVVKETTMPYVNIKITNEGATAEQKAELIKGATDLLFRVLGKNKDNQDR